MSKKKQNGQYYDGTRLLSLTDADGNKPEIYMVTTNRTGGKTTYFGRLLVNAYKNKHEKFGLIYRFKDELDNIGDKFFKDIQGLFFPDDNFRAEKRENGAYCELFLNDEPCGYAFALNMADKIKKYSHLFSDCDRMLMDEFQSETDHYCSKEVEKFQSLHTSVARGQGKQSRYVPVYMLGNSVSVLNPYYIAMGITTRLNANTNFLRGSGWVLEQGYVDSASKALQESGFNKAFANSNSRYALYSTKGVYLNDNLAFIEKPEGKNTYIATLKYMDKQYALRFFKERGIIYCDDRADVTFGKKISVTTEDHDINYMMLDANLPLLSLLKTYFEKGYFRFKDMSCKQAVLTALSYM